MERRQMIPAWFVDETATPTHALRGVKELRTQRDAHELLARLGAPDFHDSSAGTRSEHIPADARLKRGSGGQIIAFVPSLDSVVTRQTGGSGQWNYEEYLGRACLAVLASEQAKKQ